MGEVHIAWLRRSLTMRDQRSGSSSTRPRGVRLWVSVMDYDGGGSGRPGRTGRSNPGSRAPTSPPWAIRSSRAALWSCSAPLPPPGPGSADRQAGPGLPRALRKLKLFGVLVIDDMRPSNAREVEVSFTLRPSATTAPDRGHLKPGLQRWDRIFKNPTTSAAAIGTVPTRYWSLFWLSPQMGLACPASGILFARAVCTQECHSCSSVQGQLASADASATWRTGRSGFRVGSDI